MAVWKVTPNWKKSIIERQTWENGGESFIWETGWRWGEFHVTTEDDTPPVLEPGVDIYNCDYDAELYECTDGCWEEYDYDDCSDETREKLEEYFEEGNSVFDLEEEGWYNAETEMIIDCEMTIEMIEPTDNTETEVIDDGKPKWPNT